MNKFLKLAVEEADKGLTKRDGGPFGAVIVCKGKVIAKAHNEVRKLNDPTAYAEIMAIRKASKKLKRFDLSDCELYTTCEPCPMCFAAIHWAGIKKVYYGACSKDAAKIGFDDKLLYEVLNGKKKSGIVMKKVPDKECVKLMEKYAKLVGGANY
jgi:guanine deaminase